MGAKKFSISFDELLADTVRDAAAEEGVSVSTWLAEAAAAKARRRHLRAALDEFEAEEGPLSEEEIDQLVAESRKNSIVTQPRKASA